MKRSGPLFRPPASVNLLTQAEPPPFRPTRDILDEFLSDVLSYTEADDRAAMLNRAQLHAQIVRRALEKEPANTDLANLIHAAVMLGQDYQRYWIDLAVRDHVRIGEAQKAAGAKGGKRKKKPLYPELEREARGLLKRGMNPRNVPAALEAQGHKLTPKRKQGLTAKQIREYLRAKGLLEAKKKRT